MKGKRQDSRAAGKPKTKAASKDRAWFERKVAELKAELDILDDLDKLKKDLSK